MANDFQMYHIAGKKIVKSGTSPSRCWHTLFLSLFIGGSRMREEDFYQHRTCAVPEHHPRITLHTTIATGLNISKLITWSKHSLIFLYERIFLKVLSLAHSSPFHLSTPPWRSPFSHKCLLYIFCEFFSQLDIEKKKQCTRGSRGARRWNLLFFSPTSDFP